MRLPASGLRVRLLLLVLLAILPPFALILYAGREERHRRATEVEEEALRLARLVSVEYKHLVDGSRELLLALSRLPPVRQADPAGCTALFADLLKRYPRYANLGASDAEGKVFCSALPLRGPVSIADRAYFRRALEARDFAVGEYQIGRVSGKASLNFGSPVLESAGRVRGVLFAALDLAWLNRLAAEAKLPQGSTLTVIDRTGMILARHPDPETWTGKAFPEAGLITAVLGKQAEGIGETAGVDGVRRLYGFAPVDAGPEASAYVAIGIPTEVAFAGVKRALVRNLAGLGIVSLLALLAAWVGSDLFVLRQVKALLGATKQLAAGDLGARAGLPYRAGELGRLAQAFDDMAGALEHHLAERKRAEEQLRRANRALRVLSRSNQWTIRAPSESELLNGICRIIVEEGGYRVAWVGFARQDEARTVEPVARWGDADGYLETVRLTWGDAEGGRGPTGTAIRTGRPCVARDIPTDPHYAPWRAEAARAGYASCIALPLVVESQSVGALNIYAAEPDAFDAGEVELLAELAGDLAFGLSSLEARAERDRALADLRTRTSQLEALRTISEEIVRELNLSSLLNLIVQRAAELVEGTSGIIALWDEPSRLLVPRAWLGLGAWVGDIRWRPGEAVIGTVAQRREGLIVNDYRTSPYAHAPALERTAITAILAEPLLYHGRLVGVITINRETGGRPFTEEDRQALTLFAAPAAVAIENARLYEELRMAAKHLEARVEDRTRELQAANEQLQAASRHKSEFLATMSHELRTPLNSIIGFSELLLEQGVGPLTDKQSRYLGHIHRSGKHLLQLISDILDLSKVEAGKFVLQPEPLPVAQTLEDILVIGRGLATKKGQTITAGIESSLPPLHADPVRFKQILFNLLSNAVKFTPEGGTIRITARRLESEQARTLTSLPACQPPSLPAFQPASSWRSS